ncbi:MAG: type II secretion system F family protein [Desulfobacteraceae bacterium]|jgi:type II secretion system protein F|nr:type II secretion system F family protein [Desulfobacteraceae bacterium]
MTTFLYKATDAKGTIFEGALDAEDKKGVIVQLQGMGYIPIRIRQAESDTFSKLQRDFSKDIFSITRRIGSKDVLLFTQDLAVLLNAGVSIDRALSILIEVSEKTKFYDILREVLQHVESGYSLSEALAMHPAIFSKLYINMIKAGEMGGVLGPVMDRLSIFLENSQELKDYITSALVYPIFLVFVGGISIIIMLVFVLPKFSIIFADMGQAIPLSTRIVLGLSDVLRNYWWLILGGFCILYISLKNYRRTESGRIRWDNYKINQPIFGKLIKMIEVARLTRTVGTLMKSGVPILSALSLVKETAGNSVVVRSMEVVYEKVKEGENLSGSLQGEGLFPALALNMIKVGEETGQLEQMLLKVADNYEKSVRNTLKRLINLLEPALILFMGIVVGFIVISMLLAVFSLNEVPF